MNVSWLSSHPADHVLNANIPVIYLPLDASRNRMKKLLERRN
jgi:hypothetical protein